LATEDPSKRKGSHSELKDQLSTPVAETRSGQRVQQPHGQAHKIAKKIIKLLLPPRVVQEVNQYRKYKRIERPIYLKIRMLDGLGLHVNKKPKNLSDARSFLFVCFGNIMRSPMCEALMRQELTRFPHIQVKVTSAGLNATPGKQAHPWALATAPQFGVSLEHHGARLLTAEMVNQADAIFAMDYQNQVELFCRYPSAREKVCMFSVYAGPDYRLVEIRDPFYGSEIETRRCYSILQTCVHNLVSTLASLTPPNPEARGRSTAQVSR
jgi:protein-tyrosine-phosphatase